MKPGSRISVAADRRQARLGYRASAIHESKDTTESRQSGSPDTGQRGLCSFESSPHVAALVLSAAGSVCGDFAKLGRSQTPEPLARLALHEFDESCRRDDSCWIRVGFHRQRTSRQRLTAGSVPRQALSLSRNLRLLVSCRPMRAGSLVPPARAGRHRPSR